MATRVPAPGELLCVDELERKLTDLSERVELKKEEVRSNFQQFHDLLFVRENFVLEEMDDIVTIARQEVAEKKETLQELHSARNALERELTQNKLKKVLEKNLRVLEGEIGEEVARGVNVGWMELEWKREELEQSVIGVCKLVSYKERSVARVDYSTNCLVSSYDGTDTGEIILSMQLVIDDTTQNIFVADYWARRMQVFDSESNYLYEISTPPYPIGIALTDEFIFVSTNNKLLLKIEKSSNKSIKSVQTENYVRGIESNNNSDIYVCEYSNQSIVVFDKVLIFQKRIKLNSTLVNSDTRTNSMKLHEGNMYVMFGHYYSPPPFHLQIFTLKGELVRCLITQGEIRYSYFFAIDPLGNIIVADWRGNQFKISSQEGKVLHAITSDMLPGDQKNIFPTGVAIDQHNVFIVAHKNKKCSLLAF